VTVVNLCRMNGFLSQASVTPDSPRLQVTLRGVV
jgi:hypothetical protein